jgi:hypothetical protein
VIQCLLPSAVTSLGSPAKLSGLATGRSQRLDQRDTKVGTRRENPVASFFGKAAASRPGFRPKRRPMPARKNEYWKRFQRDLPCQALSEKIFCFSELKITLISSPSRPQRGVSRTSRTRVGMRWTLAALVTKAFVGGRPSRVVLMPRRRHQACKSRKRRWQQSPIAGESTKQLLNHCAGSAGRCRCDRGDLTTLVWHFFRPARLRVHYAPGIPCALTLKGSTKIIPRAKKFTRRDREAVSCAV